jgi:biopolymer transport protein ExbB/TolQ
MFDIFARGGFYMWPLAILALTIFFLSIKKIYDLFIRENPGSRVLESGLNAIFFWGGISAVIGFLAHFHGMYEAMLAITKANDISPGIVAEGFAVSLITILFGLIIFFFASISWLFLRWRFKQITS